MRGYRRRDGEHGIPEKTDGQRTMLYETMDTGGGFMMGCVLNRNGRKSRLHSGFYAADEV